MTRGVVDLSIESGVAGIAEVAGTPSRALLPRLLAAARQHLGMEIAFISHFSATERIFCFVDSERPVPIKPGDADLLEETYCQHIVDRRLPGVITDASASPTARELPLTEAFPVGSYLGVPIVLSDGLVYGTFCCFSTRPEPTLNERDLDVLKTFAHLAAQCIEDDLQANRARDLAIDRIRSVLDDDKQLRMVFQPIVSTDDGSLLGVEALSRFAAPPVRPPNLWFAEATSVGLGIDLELRAVRAALAALSELPSEAFLAVNVSPEIVLSGRLEKDLARCDLSRIVLEMTEHAPIADYQELHCALTPLREGGGRLAVDDAGAGYASFRHILWLEPEFIKLDMSITHQLHVDPAHAALAAALIGFASSVGSRIIAEGVEEEAELRELALLGAHAAQGYYLARPGSLQEAVGFALGH